MRRSWSVTRKGFKMRFLSLLLAVALAASLVVIATLMISPNSDVPPVAVGPHEVFELTVLKVFSARDGNARFRAYLVEYEGQQVIVRDVLASTDHAVGDSIGVLVGRYVRSREIAPHDVLGFMLSDP